VPHELFFVVAVVDHEVVSQTLTVNRVKSVVILGIFGWTVIFFAFAVFIMRVVAAATFHATMHPLLAYFMYKLNFLLVIEGIVIGTGL